MPKVSVIVPVYNTEKYLPRCIESILAQTFTDFELILVNDGSTDNSGKICDEYAKKDSRIVVIHKENGGASSARNKGIDNAKGEWIAFVDSDDFVSEHFLYNFINALSDNTDLIIGGITKIDESKNILETRKYDAAFINFCQDFSYLFEKKILQKHNGPCAKLYKLSIINEHILRFHEDIISGEDVIFNYNYYIYVVWANIIETSDYYYATRSGSLTTQGIFPFSQEKQSYQLYMLSAFKLTSQFEIHHPYIYERECLFIDKLINAIYHEKFNRKKRLSELAKITFDKYLLYKKTHSLKEYILVQLLSKKKFWLYDLIRMLWSKYH